jgi:hypothetical protein
MLTYADVADVCNPYKADLTAAIISAIDLVLLVADN